MVMKYSTLNLGQIEALGNILGGEDNIVDILRGNIKVTLERVSFPVWMTVEIGGHPKEELVPLLERDGFFVSDWAKYMMRQDAFTTLPEQQKLKLARCKVRDLGFTERPTTAQLQQRVKERGGKLCPAELGPHLRRQLKDQRNGDIFWLVMEQIADSRGDPRVFELYRDDDGERRFVGSCVNPGVRWLLGHEVVFVLAN